MDDMHKVVSVPEWHIFRVPTQVYIAVRSTNHITAKLKLGGQDNEKRGEASAFRDYKNATYLGTVKPENTK